jgi:Stigma-specific protein, Stig1
LASFPGVAWANDRCSQGQTRCGDRCVNLQTNERHCGSCRNRCGSTQTCCGGRYVNLKRSERHCGSCSNRCAAGEQCDHGVCQGGSCPPGRTLTEGDCHCAFVCGDPFPSPATCQDNPNCLCSETTEGTGFCAGPGAGGCPPECSSSSDCEPGSMCVLNTCCDHPVCLPPCTPTCAQNGSICTSGTQCCSGLVCKGPSGQGTCAASCIPPSAIPCDPVNHDSCAGGTSGGCTCGEASEGGGYCGTTGTGIPCSTSCDCPAGQYCSAGAPTGLLCAVAATVCPVG